MCLLIGAGVLILGGVPAPSALGAKNQVCVRVARANLRTGAGMKFRISWEVNRYMPFITVGEKGEWVRVKDVDGDLHYIHGRLISNEIDCVTIKAARANIRSKPNSRSRKWFTVEKYTSFKRVGKEGKWVQIEFEGQKMWVFHTLVWPG